MTNRFLPFKHRFIFASLAILLTVFAVRAQESQPWSQNTSPLPAPTGFVNDYAGVLDPATKQTLEATLKNLKETTDPQVEIAVAIVKTTGERPIFDYSLAVARGWGIGSKQDDNPSALLFVAIDDRKYFTHVSRDLEDELPDGAVGSLQRQFLVPEFRKGNYGKGIADTIDAYISTIRNKGNVPVDKPAAAGKSETSASDVFFPLFCCAVLIIVVFAVGLAAAGKSKSKSDRDRWGGGGFGSGGGGGSDIASAVIGGIIGSALSGGSSSSSDWGGSSGGGSDWGGFGGGGDFGGGGGGGDW